MNLRHLLPFFPTVSILLFCCASTVMAERTCIDLAKDWKFIKQDVDSAAPTGNWDAVTVPHTWNNLDAQMGVRGNPTVAGGYFRGACWYERSLDVPAAWQGKRVFIRFEAASIVAHVYLNGESVGEHRGAFTAFCFELTSHLKFGQANELRVRVDNSNQPDVPPLSGDFNMDGGIYRPVKIIVTDEVCITPLDFASPGIYETIKSLDDQHASVEIKSLISNGETTGQSPQVETIIKDASGTVIAQHTQTQTIAAGQTVPATEVLDISNPHRWNARKDPYLYSVTVRVHRGNDVVGEVVQPLGLRTVAITQAQGFLLNGNPYPIHGVSRHQDRRDEGWALSAEDHQQDADLILGMGVTAVRNTHYPQSGTWHDLADRSGLLMWDEVSLVRTINDTPAFTAGSELEAREMILQLYNHPSIAFWGLFNELGNLPTPPPDTMLKNLKSLIKELDPSRVIVAATDHMNKSYNLIPDWPCYNIYPGWYGPAAPGPDDTINQFSKEIGRRTALSEYGAGGNPFQHQEGPIKWVGSRTMASGPLHPEEYQAAVHEVDYAQIVANPNLWGSFIWTMFDFASTQKNEGGTVGINDKGMVTQDRAVKKDVYFFYQANWSEEPMIYITSRRMTPRKQPTTEIKIYSNLPSVQLKVNGLEIPAVQPDKVHVFRWENVTLQPGDNQIEAIGTTRGKTLSDHCTWVLQAAPNTTGN
jgi:beta-galactosidase